MMHRRRDEMDAARAVSLVQDRDESLVAEIRVPAPYASAYWTESGRDDEALQWAYLSTDRFPRMFA
jgi:hypothetical protein